MPIVEKSDHSRSSARIEDAHYFEANPAISVWSWSPEPAGTVNAKATQVQLHIGSPPGNVFIVRFKGTASLDALIDALQEHRLNVFGKRP